MSMNVSSNYNPASVGGQYFRNGNDKKQLDAIKQSGNKIHEEVVKVEISSEGLKALKDEEKIAFLQESLQTAGSLHRIEQGSDIRLKYGYVSAGELMKEKAPEEYEKYSFLLTKGFERNDENILLDATRYMLDWQSEFEKDAPIFQNYQKFRDDWDAILKSYGFVKR